MVVFMALKPAKVKQHYKKEQPDYFFEDVVITQLFNGEQVWEMRSAKAQIDKKSEQVLLENIDLDLFKNLKSVVQMQSLSASMNMSDTDIYFEKASANFVLEGTNKAIGIKADTLLWLADSQKFIGKENVKIISNRMSLSGTDFTADLPIRKIVVSGSGKALIKNI